MKSKLIVCIAAILFVFVFSKTDNTEAQNHSYECKGSSGHCMEFEDTTYYGKLIVGPKEIQSE
jgi:hypothetical protein